MARIRKYIFDRQSGVVPQYYGIGTNASGDTSLLAASSGRKIRVYALALSSAGDVDAYFRSAVAGDAITGKLSLSEHSNTVLPFSSAGWFETDEGEALVINLSAGVYVGGSLVYAMV